MNLKRYKITQIMSDTIIQNLKAIRWRKKIENFHSKIINMLILKRIRTNMMFMDRIIKVGLGIINMEIINL